MIVLEGLLAVCNGSCSVNIASLAGDEPADNYLEYVLSHEI